MSQGRTASSGLVQVTVASGSRRVDLVLPASVPVAELVPELARSVGLLDAATVYGGYRLVAQDGRVLDLDAGLTMQGVEDGGLLTVAAGIDDEAPRVYDDVVEAMADVVERELRPWRPEAGRRTALTAAALLLVTGAAALLVGDADRTLTAVGAGVVAVVLLVAGTVLSRAQHEPESAVVMAWTATLYAAVAGLVAGADEPGTTALAYAGAAALVAGLVALAGYAGAGRPLVLPPLVLGAVVAVTSLLVETTDVSASAAFTAAGAVVVLLGSVFPWLAIGLTRTDVDQLFTQADITADPRDVDPRQVGSDARLAHEILLAVSGTAGLVLLVATPFAVDRGVLGAVTVVVAAALLMLRTRQYRAGTQVLVGLGAGVAALVVAAASVLVLQPDWRGPLAVVLAVVGGAVLATTLVPSSPSVLRGRIGDVLETACLVALLPLTVFAAGVFAAIRG